MQRMHPAKFPASLKLYPSTNFTPHVPVCFADGVDACLQPDIARMIGRWIGQSTLVKNTVIDARRKQATFLGLLARVGTPYRTGLMGVRTESLTSQYGY